MNWSHVTAMKVVVMILLVSNGLFSMDSIERTKSPVSQWDKTSEVNLDTQEELDKLFEGLVLDKNLDLLSAPKPPVSQWDKVEKVDLDAEIDSDTQKSLDNIFGERLSASEKEKLDEIKAYLQTYDAIKLKNGDFIKYPLHKAVREGREKIDDIRFLCEYGANILSYSYSGMQPLHYLPYLSDEASAVEIAAILHGHSFNLMASPTRSCIMPLTLAIEAKKFVLANKFIELGAPVNLEPDSTQQPLLLAIKSGNEGLVDTLLAMGANPLNSDTLEYLNTIDDSSPKARQYVRTIKSKLRKAMLNQIQAME